MRRWIPLLLSCALPATWMTPTPALAQSAPAPIPETSSTRTPIASAGACPAPEALPAWLPHYDIDIRLDTAQCLAEVHQTVRWTNAAAKPTDHLMFHVYPRHRPTKAQQTMYERTLESLRLDPLTAFDREGRRLRIRGIRSGDAILAFVFDPDNDTVMRVELPEPVAPGETVELEIDFDLSIPPIQGRFGNWLGVTNLLHWHPIVAYYGVDGWDTPPYVAWHQPWLNEAGNYKVALTVPAGEEVATSGQVVSTEIDETGWKRLEIVGYGLRDFAIVASKRFETHQAEVDGVKISVLAFPEHRFYARQALRSATECVALYGHWFGPYAHPEFKVVESYFGWNGNESSGMILIDERVFDAPHLGHRYVDHLVSHEVCHQWWYSAVGTDGFRESWMDEALVVFLTEQRMRLKYGRDVELLDWPKPLSWAPNIDYRTLQHYGYHLYRARGGRGATLDSLPKIGHLHNLFFLAYDRGSMVVSMIQQRLGEREFLEFLRIVYAKYRYRILFVEDFRHELETYTGRDWNQFFEDWLRSPKIADWKVAEARTESDAGGYRTTVTVRQLAEIDEPVTVAYRTAKKGPIVARFPLEPEAGDYDADGLHVRKTGPHEWELAFSGAERPRQIIIDPDQKILDANPKNNRWKFEPQVRFAPIYTPLEEIPLVHPLDRPSFVAGPGVDDVGRLGFFASYLYANRYRVTPYLTWLLDSSGNNPFVAGVDAVVYNTPVPNVTLGTRYERTLADPLIDDPYDQGRLYLRWNQAYTTSFIYEDLAFLEVYFRGGDNFWPNPDVRRHDAPGVEVYRDIRALGVWYHVDTQMPYWNPEKGYRFDANYEYGLRAFGAGETFHRVWSQGSAVHKLPEGLGYLSRTRLAGRLGGGVGSPDNGNHFQLGGPLRFRGQRSEDTEGSAFWVASAEWRLPLLTRLDLPIHDNVANWRSLYGAAFYDVGESFLFDQSQGVDHAVGLGLYFDLALFSFLEELTLRLEYAHSLRHDTNVAWFGLYHAF